jgi:DNA primase
LASASYDSGFIDRVRGAVDLVALVSESVPLTKSGRKFRGLCPFHAEKTPSFYVDDGKNLFYCFGCHAGGDAFKFVQLRENVEFLDAARLLARRLGIPVPEARSGGSRPSERETLLGVHRAAADFYHQTLTSRPEGAPARAYLASRGITPETIAALGIGWAPDRWDALKGHLAGKGYQTDLLVTGGLLVKHEVKGSTYDRFRKRVMFPIKDLTGEVVGLGGRILGDGEPKYLNSAETPIYNKRDNLFGLHATRHGIREAGEAVVVEGYFDFATLWQAGIPHVCATLGTAFAEQQAALLRRFTERVVINYDPDAAGASATRRGIELLVAQGFKVRVLRLPGGLDPDDFVHRHGAHAYLERLKAAPRYFDYLLESAMAGTDPADFEAKSSIVKSLLPVLTQMPDRIERAGYVNLMAERLRIDDEIMRADMRDAVLKGPQRKQTAAPAPTGSPIAKVGEAEQRLVRAVVEMPDIRTELLDLLSIDDLSGTVIEEIMRAVDSMNRSGAPVSYTGLLEVLREPARSLLARLAMRQEPVVSHEEAVRCAESIRLRRLRTERDKLQKEMEGEVDSARLEDLMRRKVEVSRQIDALS